MSNFFIISILLFVKIIRDDLFYLWLWQIKEYRADRMISYLKEKYNYRFLVLWIIIFSYFIFAEHFINIYETTLVDYVGIYSPILSFIYFFAFLTNICLPAAYLVYCAFEISNEVGKKKLKRPKLTLKINLIFVAIVIFYLLWFWFIIGQYEFKASELFLFIFVINPLLISAIVLFVNPAFNFQKRKIIKRAAEKMRSLKNVKVIGITGSYGKTSTKEFLYSILSQKYKVVKTEGNNNTNIGVAYTVLNKIDDSYGYFICEMGAYKIGEIKETCEIVEPDIGVLTGINEQHADLFGSIENTIKAKFELIETLPEDGLVIINSSVKYQASSIKAKNIKYFSLNEVNNIKVYQDYAEFEYKNRKLKANLLGKHYIENLLSAIIVAEHLGMSLDEISKGLENIKPTEYMMRKLEGANGSIFIDDSYSANPDGVIAALDYLNEAYVGYNKIIVFPGIIELGNKSKKVHKKLFERINEVCDVACILNQNLENTPLTPLKRGIKENRCKFIFKKDFDKAAEMLKGEIDEKSVILFESRGARVAMRKMKNL